VELEKAYKKALSFQRKFESQTSSLKRAQDKGKVNKPAMKRLRKLKEEITEVHATFPTLVRRSSGNVVAPPSLLSAAELHSSSERLYAPLSLIASPHRYSVGTPMGPPVQQNNSVSSQPPTILGRTVTYLLSGFRF